MNKIPHFETPKENNLIIRLTPRKINQALLDELTNDAGLLNPLLRYVQDDHTLDMELRGDCVDVYYRGGLILSATLDKEGKAKLTGSNYKHSDNEKKSVVQPSVDNIDEYFPAAKHAIDVHFSKASSWEREIQQRVVMENNYSQNSWDTDFFVIDIEYKFGIGTKKNPEFDIVTLYWPSTKEAHKNPVKGPLKILIFELKQGNKSLKNKSGLLQHLKDFNDLISDRRALSLFIEDMTSIFIQKGELGLLGKENQKLYKKIKKIQPGNISPDDIALVFLLANHKPVKALKTVLDSEPNLKFIFSNLMGYGLYKQNIRNAGEMPWKFYET